MWEKYDLQREQLLGRNITRSRKTGFGLFAWAGVLIVTIQLSIVASVVWVAIHFARKYW